MAGKVAISPASAKLKSVVHLAGVHPKDVLKMFGFRMTPEQAVALATGLLAVAADQSVEGFIRVTVRPKQKYLTIIRDRK